MANVSAVTSFILTAYTELEAHRYLYFAGFLFLYIVILLVNLVLIVVILSEKSLHGPMYLFICNLSVNGVCGSTFILPSVLSHLLSHNYEISLSFCLLQIYCIFLYGIVEFTILAVMSYDRYVAICHPLHYHLLMSPRKVTAAIVLSWVVPCVYFALYLILTTVRLSFCDRYIEKMYCMNFELVKLSCRETSFIRFLGAVLLLVCPSPQIVMILFSYACILRVCLTASKESQAKAIQTCTPHLLSVINLSVGCLYEIVQGRFNMSHIPLQARIFLSLHTSIVPPLFNPLVYGISIQAIKVQIIKFLSSKKSETH
ncbi:olfactory receptor 1496-like [Anguilla anguilla]|uniref:olfactory receptor 1496-like n=1 Tax=Anguilla anguilla TaxID=7936 RepID=UPI0015AA6E2F|nr:olfactory receptor 1496-like [Anguilla anguilla]XP_035240399.1 olfactory receptor 1496-like [Anguilla anguilla]XP_035240400.1 olfactory receptor 1496-like [Anguilla anguilla]